MMKRPLQHLFNLTLFTTATLLAFSARATLQERQNVQQSNDRDRHDGDRGHGRDHDDDDDDDDDDLDDEEDVEEDADEDEDDQEDKDPEE
jgi:hypothetical protein